MSHNILFSAATILIVGMMASSVLSFTTTTVIKASSPALSFRNGRYMQRANDVVFDWPGLCISTRFLFAQNGNMSAMNRLEVSVLLQDEGNYYSFNLWRMQGSTRVAQVQQVVLATEKKLNAYTVVFQWAVDSSVAILDLELEMEKRTEPMVGVATFGGFTLLHNGNFLRLMDRNVRQEQEFKIEFIGDSSTCAYGNLGKPPCSYSPSTQNIHESFVEMAARKLNATEIHVECWSGKGVVRNYGSVNTTAKDPFPVFYPRSVGNDASSVWDFSKFIPDMVVIALGSNDFSTPPRPSFEEFSAGYDKLVDFVLTKYLPSMMKIYADYVQKIATSRELYGKQIFFVNIWERVNLLKDDWGCDDHPNVSGDEKVSNVLYNFIRQHVLTK